MNYFTSAVCYAAFGIFALALLRSNAQLAEFPALETGLAAQASGEVRGEQLSEKWTDAEVFALRAFSEPLVADPSEVASVEENAAFVAAISAYLLSRQPEVLEAFLRVWPQSRWATALEHNLGVLRYEAGYFTAAMGYWQSAWNRSKHAKDAQVRAVANQSVARLAGMYARLGRIETLRPLLSGLKGRSIGGSAEQIVSTSWDALRAMEARPDDSFKCGPFALADVRHALGYPDALAKSIREAKSPYRGYSLPRIPNYTYIHPKSHSRSQPLAGTVFSLMAPRRSTKLLLLQTRRAWGPSGLPKSSIRPVTLSPWPTTPTIAWRR